MTESNKEQRIGNAIQLAMKKEDEQQPQQQQQQQQKQSVGQTETDSIDAIATKPSNVNKEEANGARDAGLSTSASVKLERKESIGSIIIYSSAVDAANNNSKQPSSLRQSSREHYLRRMDTFMSQVKTNQIKVKTEKKKELLFGATVVWYLARRYHATDNLTWPEYIRHFLPYPLTAILAATIQICVLILLGLDTEAGADTSTTANQDIRLAQARLMALIILTAYILMTGRNIRDFIHCIAFDAMLQEDKCLFGYVLLPLGQGVIEALALYISSIIILDSESVVDVFKDTVAIMFVLEVDTWMAAALNMRDLGLTQESLIIDFSNDESKFDEFIVSIVYGALTVLRFGIMAWAGYNAILGTFIDGAV